MLTWERIEKIENIARIEKVENCIVNSLCMVTQLCWENIMPSSCVTLVHGIMMDE